MNCKIKITNYKLILVAIKYSCLQNLLLSLGGEVQKVLLERGNKPEKGVDVEMGGSNFFITYSSIRRTVFGGL